MLDFSFSSRKMREVWRRLVAEHDIAAETTYAETEKETCLSRLRARSHPHDNDFILSPGIAAQYFDHVEPPTDDEGPLTVHR